MLPATQLQTLLLLSWTAATDNVGVTSYDIYANGTLKATVSVGTTTSTIVSGLSPLTQYTFYIIAKDAFANSSPQSTTATETTLDVPAGGGNCGTENFEMITGPVNTYMTVNWTNNGISWTATDARVDQTINNKAITIKKWNFNKFNFLRWSSKLNFNNSIEILRKRRILQCSCKRRQCRNHSLQ